MKVKQIILSFTQHGNDQNRHRGKDIFVGATAIPDGPDWSLEEAEQQYFVLGKSLTKTLYLLLLGKGMIEKEAYHALTDGTNKSYDTILSKLKDSKHV